MNENKKQTTHLYIYILCAILCTLLLTIGILSIFSAQWYLNIYGNVGLDAVLFTLFSSMDSVESSLLVSFVQEAAIPAAIVLIILCILIFAKSQRKIVLHIGNKIRFKIYPLSKVASIATAFVAALCLLFVAAEKMQVFSYLQSTSNATTFIEENYVDPNTTEIVFPQQKQNLIYIDCACLFSKRNTDITSNIEKA